MKELTYDDRLSVRAAFELSYQRLTADEAHVFRVLALHFGRHVTVEAAAALSGFTLHRAKVVLRSLRRAHLIEPGKQYGWFRFHDLLRLFAEERAHAQEDTELAAERLLAYYFNANGVTHERLGMVARARSVPAPNELSSLDAMVVNLYQADHRTLIDVITPLAPHIRVLVISEPRTPADIREMIQAGANGYVNRDAVPTAILSAVRTVLDGGFALSAELAAVLRAELAAPTSSIPLPLRDESVSTAAGARPVLSPREEETLRWIARGFTHTQTARRMGVSKTTVDTYVERVRAKLQVGNEAELLREALEREQRQQDTEDP